jgi:hypothetical protein
VHKSVRQVIAFISRNNAATQIGNLYENTGLQTVIIDVISKICNMDYRLCEGLESTDA